MIFLGFIMIESLVAWYVYSFVSISAFPFGDSLKQLSPVWLQPFAHFDGMHYMRIAREGYGQYQQAYFPLLPWLINQIARLVGQNYLLVGASVSWMSLLVGFWYFVRFTKLHFPQAVWPVVMSWITFPTAFFYLTIYPESLYFALAAALFYFVSRGNHWQVTIFGFLAALAKLQGVFLAFVIWSSPTQKKNKFAKLTFLAPVVGLLSYMYYLWRERGDPLYFYHAQEAFGANRTSAQLVLLPQVLWRYTKILVTAAWNMQYFVAAMELVVFLWVGGVVLWYLWQEWKNSRRNSLFFSLAIYSLLVLVLPTLTGTLSSMPRYALIAFIYPIVIGTRFSHPAQLVVWLVSAGLQIILASLYFRGVFIG